MGKMMLIAMTLLSVGCAGTYMTVPLHTPDGFVVKYDINTVANDVMHGDFNGDGNEDLALFQSDSVTLLLADGHGAYSLSGK